MAANDRDVEDLVLLRVDEQCARLQQDGQYLEALEFMERSLVLRRCLYGNDHDETIQACKKVVDTCNGLATAYLSQDNFSMAIELIKKAEKLSESYDFLRAVTYNNLACYYRRQNKLRTSLKYLEKALKLSTKQTDIVSRASTHLNLCAVLSQLGRHVVALEQAQAALILLQEDLFNAMVKPLQEKKESAKLPDIADKIAVLAIAYHNAGVEHEYLKRYESSLEAYTKASELAGSYLGHDHEITKTLSVSKDSALKQIRRKNASRNSSVSRGRPTTSPLGQHDTTLPEVKRPSTSASFSQQREFNLANLNKNSNSYQRVDTSPASGHQYFDMISPRNLDTDSDGKTLQVSLENNEFQGVSTFN